MIEQQYYTRERGGLFSQADGYDTVAKSPQLRLDYIKKNLHPLCSYDMPSQLQKSGEQDEKKYPPNFIIVPMESGETIVGQAIYKSKDFTGLRSAFFMHNFILSGNERRRYIKEPEKLFGITGFADHYELADGRVLPTLAAIPYEVPYLFENREQFFQKIGMTDKIFHQLIYAAFMTVYSKKKIFIVLNVPIEKLGDYAKALLYFLYAALPWSIAERLGVSTYSAKAEPRKNIQITFLDQDTLQYDSRINKEFIFDFVNQRFLNGDEDIESSEYIKIALMYAGNKMAWERYNQLADELAGTIRNEADRNMHFYGRAALLFEMSLYLRGRRYYELSSTTRKGLLQEILGYCKARLSEETANEMDAMMEYVISLIHEPINKGILWSIDEVKTLLQYKLQLYEKNRDQFDHCQQIVLCLLGEAVKEKKQAYADEVLRETRYYLGFYQQLFAKIYADPLLRNGILYRQVESSLVGVDNIEELISQMGSWEPVEETLLMDTFYEDLVTEKFTQLLEKPQNKVQLLMKVQKWCKRHEGTLYEKLMNLVEQYFLDRVDLEREIASSRELCSLSFHHAYEEKNYEVIMLYQRLTTDISTLNPSRVRINEKVQRLVKRFYEQEPGTKDFYMLVYAFLTKGKMGEPHLLFKKLLYFLYGIDQDLMFAFIVWSKGQDIYMDKGRFDSEVINFFNKLKEKKIKISNDVIREKLGSKAKTSVLAEKIIRSQRSGLANFFCDYKKNLIAVLIILIATGGAGGGYFFYSQSQKKKALQETFKVQSVSDEAVKALTGHIAYPVIEAQEAVDKLAQAKAADEGREQEDSQNEQAAQEQGNKENTGNTDKTEGSIQDEEAAQVQEKKDNLDKTDKTEGSNQAVEAAPPNQEKEEKSGKAESSSQAEGTTQSKTQSASN